MYTLIFFFFFSLQILRPKQFEDYEKMMEELEEMAINFSTKLVIIDSITHILKKRKFSEKDKEIFFTNTTNHLKNISEKCYCVVLVTNQLKLVNERSFAKENNIEEEKDEGAATNNSSLLNQIFLNKIIYGEIIKDYDQYFVPTLGTLWYHCVNIRLVMNRSFKNNQAIESIRNDLQSKVSTMFNQDNDVAMDKIFSMINADNYNRYITIEKSPLVAKTSFLYEITATGIEVKTQGDTE